MNVPLLPLLGLICVAVGIGMLFGGLGLVVLGLVLMLFDFAFTARYRW